MKNEIKIIKMKIPHQKALGTIVYILTNNYNYIPEVVKKNE